MFSTRPTATQIRFESLGWDRGVLWPQTWGIQRLTAEHTGAFCFQVKLLLLAAIIHRCLYRQDGVEVVAVLLHTPPVNVGCVFDCDEQFAHQFYDALC